MKYWFFMIQKTTKREEYTTDEVLPILCQHTAYFKELAKQKIGVMAGSFAQQTDQELVAGC
jgi:hypothetical protein